MIAVTDIENPGVPVTDGEIAAINLQSARLGSWRRFAHDPRLPGVAEALVDQERLVAQFLGDLDAFDRLSTLASQFARADGSYRAALVQADAASAGHRFAEARDHVARAGRMGAPPAVIERHKLSIDQACGVELDAVLSARRRIAGASGRLEDLVPLGAVLADLERFDEADAIYRDAVQSYQGIAPFPLAWAAFQLGMLWGELAPIPDPDRASQWYRRAISYVPGYVKARVHLAEVLGPTDEAEALLLPVLSSGDPEVAWRLADIFRVREKFDDADRLLETARAGFETLLDKHLLAFADHAAAFYAGSGNDLPQAFELARVNAANRPTRRALRQANAIGETPQSANPVNFNHARSGGR